MGRGGGLLILSNDEILIPAYFCSVPVEEITQPASNLLATPLVSCYHTCSLGFSAKIFGDVLTLLDSMDSQNYSTHFYMRTSHMEMSR
jgi:hypothetical protein